MAYLVKGSVFVHQQLAFLINGSCLEEIADFVAAFHEVNIARL